jgi:hypothetical protein
MAGFGARTDQRIDPFEDSPDYLPLLEHRFGCAPCLGRLTKLPNGRVIFRGMKSSPWFWTGSKNQTNSLKRRHRLAWFFICSRGPQALSGRVENQWDANPNYLPSTLGRRKARNYPELGLSTTLPIYESFRLHSESVQCDPERFTALWHDFQP